MPGQLARFVAGNTNLASTVSEPPPRTTPRGSQTKVDPMSQPIRTIGAGVLGALIVAVAALSSHAGPAAGAPSPSADTPAANTITVSASGKISQVPDVARVSLGVSQTKPTVKAAREAAATRMTNIIAAMKALGVTDADIQTVGLNLYPQYANGSSTKIIGYTVGNQIQITVRDIDKADEVVDTATAKGATEVNGISFDIADPAKATNDARVSAIAAAQVSAAAMASAAHLSLGSVVSITDTTPPSPIVYGGALGRFAAADAATPIQPGSQDVSATVTVVFAIN